MKSEPPLRYTTLYGVGYSSGEMRTLTALSRANEPVKWACSHSLVRPESECSRAISDGNQGGLLPPWAPAGLGIERRLGAESATQTTAVAVAMAAVTIRGKRVRFGMVSLPPFLLGWPRVAQISREHYLESTTLYE